MRRVLPLTIHEILIVTATVALTAAVVTPRVLVPRARPTSASAATAPRTSTPPSASVEGMIFFTTGECSSCDSFDSVPHGK